MPACRCARIEASGGIALPELQRIAALHLHDRHGSLRHSSAVRSSSGGSHSNLFDAARGLAAKAATSRSHAPATELRMSMRAVCCVPVVAAGMIGATLALGADTALAAVECLTDPNRTPPEGSHWFYRIDRPTDRRCWYLRPWSAGASPAPATETQRTTARSPAAQTVPRTKPPLSDSAPAAEAHGATAGSTAEQTAQRARPPLSESDQAALFLEFLRWKEQQKTAP
jgi:hypothetical protein